MARSADRRKQTTGKPGIPLDSIVDRLRAQLNEDLSGLETALRLEPPVSIRVNTAKWKAPIGDPVPWCSTGHYLPERPSFTFDPRFHAGAYYVQEPSSMLLEQAVKATGSNTSKVTALDLCAAPGGKSTHLRNLLHTDSLLVCNEMDRKRQMILTENVWKWGAPNCVVTGSPPFDLLALPETFDLIAVDAPCSGQGMFRKDPFAWQQWTPSLVDECALVQEGILDHAWQALKPGGFLIYSTCTWEIAENEEQVERLRMKGGESVPIPVDRSWGACIEEGANGSGLRCYPHRVRGEGFFIAVIRKPGGRTSATKTRPSASSRPAAQNAVEWLHPDREWIELQHGEDLYAIDAEHSGTIGHIAASLRVLSPGTPLIEGINSNMRPHPALALSTVLDRDQFASLVLDDKQAVDYLRGVALSATNSHGPALATFAGLGIGWLNGAGNRWNNRWPTAWRIRAQQPSASLVSWASDGLENA